MIEVMKPFEVYHMEGRAIGMGLNLVEMLLGASTSESAYVRLERIIRTLKIMELQPAIPGVPDGDGRHAPMNVEGIADTVELGNPAVGGWRGTGITVHP